jgi:hypothetical protein
MNASVLSGGKELHCAAQAKTATTRKQEPRSKNITLTCSADLSTVSIKNTLTEIHFHLFLYLLYKYFWDNASMYILLSFNSQTIHIKPSAHNSFAMTS